MKFAIISDIHFPPEITRITVLQSDCGYKDSFYFNLEDDLKNLNPNEIDAFIVCGDLCWDFIYFSSLSNWDFNLHIDMLIELRNWIQKDIPIIFIEGNHDLWLDSYIYSEEGITYFNKDEYENHLFEYYNLNSSWVEEILSDLKFNGDQTEIGQNIYILRKSGLLIKDVFIYGFPFYDKKDLDVPWSRFKDQLMKEFNNAVNEKLRDIEETPIKTILCHHLHPPALKFIQEFKNPLVEIKALYWGHYHTVPQDFIEKLANHGPYQCVMPEKNNHKIQIYEF